MTRLFLLLFALKIVGLSHMAWFWVIVWGILALNWTILKAVIKEGLKK